MDWTNPTKIPSLQAPQFSDWKSRTSPTTPKCSNLFRIKPISDDFTRQNPRIIVGINLPKSQSIPAPNLFDNLHQSVGKSRTRYRIQLVCNAISFSTQPRWWHDGKLQARPIGERIKCHTGVVSGSSWLQLNLTSNSALHRRLTLWTVVAVAKFCPLAWELNRAKKK